MASSSAIEAAPGVCANLRRRLTAEENAARAAEHCLNSHERGIGKVGMAVGGAAIASGAGLVA
jgi:hypothetical protein